MIEKLMPVLVFLFLSGSCGLSATAETRCDLAIGAGLLSGDSTYRVGGRIEDASGIREVPFPLSKLEFPLDVYMISLKGNIVFAGKWKLGVGVKKNLSRDAGEMADSDWGVWWLEGKPGATPGSLDVYSESDAELDVWMLDVNLRYKFYEQFQGRSPRTARHRIRPGMRWSYFVGVGYTHQDFDYDVKNLDQWYPSTPSRPHLYQPGKALAYEVKHGIPYIEVGAEFGYADKLSIAMSIGGSVWVHSEDEDVHILRETRYTTDYNWDGEAILFSLEGRYNLPGNWFLRLEGDYKKIDGEGRSQAFSEDRLSHKIDQEIESRQVSGSLMMGYAF